MRTLGGRADSANDVILSATKGSHPMEMRSQTRLKNPVSVVAPLTVYAVQDDARDEAWTPFLFARRRGGDTVIS